MRYTDRHSNQGSRYPDHVCFTLGGIVGNHSQVAVGCGKGTVVHHDPGIAFCGEACVTYADTHCTNLGLDRTDADGIFFICRYIPLARLQGNAAALYRRIFNRNIIQPVQMENCICYVHRKSAY